MKIVRAISAGVLIWFLGVLSFSISFYVPVMENMEQQANLILFIAIVPIVWLGSSLYYGKGIYTHGLKTGITFFSIAAVLDALITVPLLVIPYGGSHYEFFTDIGFWLIGLEFVGTTVLYRYFKIKRTREFI